MEAALPISRYTIAEENANTITGAISTILAVVGSIVLIASVIKTGTILQIVSSSVFAATLILLYTASTLYHGARDPRAKHNLMILDHSAIFLLIAGTYTPLTLISLWGPWGWSIFGTTWGLAFLGIVFESKIRDRHAIRVGLYIAMGWIVLLATKPMMAAVAPMGLVLILTGGVAYTIGVGFYAWHRLPYHHAIWHVFVLAGSTAHFFAILLYVIPPKG